MLFKAIFIHLITKNKEKNKSCNKVIVKLYKILMILLSF